MKKSSIVISICIVMLSMTACKKENDTPKFSAAGIWKGNIYVASSMIINRENGTMLFYFQIVGNDTASAAIKAAGTYTVDRDIYRAVCYSETDTIRMETIQTSARIMRGIVDVGTGAAPTFEFIKQE